MNRRKSSRSRRRRPSENDNPKLMRVCKLNKAVAPTDVRASSIYEIDIKSSINFYNEDNPLMKVCIANVAPVALEKKNNGRNEEFSVFENPFIESHYPRFREVDSESDRRPSFTEKADLIIQTSFSSDLQGPNGQKQTTPSPEKKDNQSEVAVDSFPELKKQLKLQLIKGLLSSNESSWPISGKSSPANPEIDLLHLHHHEHHHYYHFDQKNLEGDDSSKPSCCDSPDTLSAKKKRPPKARNVLDEKIPKHTYFYTCESKSDLTLTKVIINDDTDDLMETQGRARKPPPDLIKNFRVRPSSSVESVLNKKPYPLKTHNYSDTDVNKCDSNVDVGDAIPLDLFKKKDSKSNNSSLVSSLKTSSHSKPTSLDLADLQSQLKAVEVKYRLPVAQFSSGTITYTEADTILESLNPDETRRQDLRDSDTTSFTLTKNNIVNPDVEPLVTWAEKIKVELNEIKKTLRIIEKEFQKSKTPPQTDAIEAKPKPEEGSAHEISVFSSRTFILRAENFYIIEEDDSVSEDIESFFESEELCYAETEKGHFFLSPNGSVLHFKETGRDKRRCWRRHALEN